MLGSRRYGKGELANTTLPRNNLLSESFCCSYRNPTQVDEERILRRSKEPSLRNSAKLPHNFGIRGVLICEVFNGANRDGTKEAQATV